jgi:hypothetical protein
MYVAPPPKPGQDPAHDAYVYLIDPHGRERYLFDVPLVAPQMVSSVRALIDGR